MMQAITILIGASALMAGMSAAAPIPPVLQEPVLGIGAARVSDFDTSCEAGFAMYIERTGDQTWRAMHRFSPACVWSPAFAVYYPFYPVLFTLRGHWENGFTGTPVIRISNIFASITVGPYGEGTAIPVQGYFEAASAYGYIWHGTMADTRLLS